MKKIGFMCLTMQEHKKKKSAMEVYEDGKRRPMVMGGYKDVYKPHGQIPNLRVLFIDQFCLVCRLYRIFL